MLFRFFATLTVAALGLIVFLLACPQLLRPHEYNLRCVKAKFATPAEQFALAAEASKRGEPVFGAIYDPQMNQVVGAYVPMRSSFAYLLLRVLNFGESFAAKEDFLPAPPAPMAFEFIDEMNASPFTLYEFSVCRKWWIGTLAAIGILSGVVAWEVKRRSHDTLTRPATIG